MHYHSGTIMQRLCCLSILAALTVLPLQAGRAQTPPPPATASSILSPALAQLRDSLSGLRLDKWKAPGPVREDASSNIGSIRNDMDATLPGLLATADAAPGSVARNFSVFENVDALYDVLLRVTETAELAAPEGEIHALEAAQSALEDARHALGAKLETTAGREEQQSAALAERVRVLEARPVATHVIEDSAKPAETHHRKSTKETHKESPQ